MTRGRFRTTETMLVVWMTLTAACIGRGGFSWGEPGDRFALGGSASGVGISGTEGSSIAPTIVAAGGESLLAVWQDATIGNDEIYVKRFDGRVWRELDGSASGGGISNNPGGSGAATAEIDDVGRPVVAWHDYSDIHPQIYLRRYNGTSWQELDGSASGGGISADNEESGFPSLAIEPSGTIAVAWNTSTSGASQIYARCFDGNVWQELAGSATGGGVSNTGGNSWNATVVMREPCRPMIAWHDHEQGAAEIYLRHYDGNLWQELDGSATGGGISQNAGDSYNPIMRLDSLGEPVVAWGDDSSGTWQIYAAQHRGNSWIGFGTSMTGGGVSNTPGQSWFPDLLIDGAGRPIVAWHDSSSGNYEIYLRRFEGSAWVGLDGSASGGGVSDDSGNSIWASLALSEQDEPMVSWYDDTSGVEQIYLLEHTSGGWLELNR